MILRGIHIEHWRCIARLDLDDFPPGVVILHGPNRTGKSSLMKALRGCLFDFDHDATGKELKESIPWNKAGTPQVAVEFETGKELYRLTKVFAKTKEGFARLEQKREGRWRVVESSSKEASRRTRELLGVNKSSAGLNQLLWLDQGIVGLPEDKELDTSVQQQLVQVLGVMVTGRDLAFKNALDKRCGKWFTEKGDKHKRESPVKTWEEEEAVRRHELQEYEAKYRAIEQVIREVEDVNTLLPQWEKEVQEAMRTLEALRQERERCFERVQRHQQAKRDLQAAEQRVQAATDKLNRFLQAKTRLQVAENEVVRSEASVDVAQQERERGERELAEKAAAVLAAQQAEEAHQQESGEIRDRRKLLDLTNRSAQVEQTLDQVRRLLQEIDLLERKVKDYAAPDSRQMEQLRQNRRDAADLRAQLQAGSLTLAVTVRRAGPIVVRLDGARDQVEDLQPGAGRSWTVRQQAGIDIPDWGVVDVSRPGKDLDLERSARQLNELDHDYEDTVRAYAEDPRDAGCLDRLVERRLERETATKRLDEVCSPLRQLAPHGLASLEKERDELDAQRTVVLQRRPELAGWQPTAEDVGLREQAFQARAGELRSAYLQRQDGADQAKQALDRAKAREQTGKEKLAGDRATRNAVMDELNRAGDPLSLQAELEGAQLICAQARQHSVETQLSTAETTIDQRCQEAEQAVKLREERLRHGEKALSELRGRLLGSEGLHSRRTEAEAALREAEEKLAQAKLEADAHKRLRDLFEQCRDNQVQQVMGPIGERVLQWSHALGLDEYREVRFGDHFLPESLVLHNGSMDHLPALADESYGTGEQLSLLVRLALGGVLARDEPVVAILDDPLAHADPVKHRRILEVLRAAAEGNPSLNPPAGPMQIFILTCHPDRFDYLTGAFHIDLAKRIVRDA